MQQQTIVLERGEDSDIWGQVHIDGALVSSVASTIEALVSEIRDLLFDMVEHGELPNLSAADVAGMQFDFAWHVQHVFAHFPWVNISAVARETGINPGLLRQFAAGARFPNEATARRIEQTLQRLGSALSNVRILTERTPALQMA